MNNELAHRQGLVRYGRGCVICVLWAVVLVVLGGSPVAARLSSAGSRLAARSPTRPSSVSADTACPDTSPSYDGPCGPLFSTPQWSDATAWDRPSSYGTLQLAKLDGAGEDLIGRDATGLWVEKFDASAGQWQLLGNVDGGLALSLPDTEGWDRPSQYRTIQTADLNGNGQTELLARAADGLHVYRWNPATATFTDISKPPRLFANAAGGDQPSVYETIQTADLFGDGHEELLARTRAGIEWARWNEHTGHFDRMTQTGVAPDAHGGGHPSLYATIQTADVSGDGQANLLLAANALRRYVLQPDGRFKEESALPTVDHAHGFGRPSQYETVRAVQIDGHQRAVVVARFANGLHVYQLIDGKWSSAAPVLSELSDAHGFDRPDQYRTIRAGDVTGHGRLDVVARTAAGITVWELQQGAWVRLSSGPALTGAVWAQASHYDTIHLGDIIGNGQSALVVRGVFGMRTFTWHDGAFRRPVPYGDFPSFSGAEASAYAEVSRLLLDRAGDFRKETYASPQSAITEATLNAYRGRLAERCTPVAARQAPGSPPRYTDCRPPAGSDVEPAAWTAVSNQIIAELWYASGVVAHFSILDNIETKLFQDQQGMLPALAADLTLPPDPPDRTPVFLKLVRGITDILSNVFQFFPGVKDYPRVIRSIAVTAQALGAVSDGLGLRSAPSPAQSYAKIIAEVPKIQQRERDITQAQRRYVLADYGLLSVIGAEVKGRLLTLDETAALSSGRQAFAVWATKLYLPAYWARYRAVNCGRYRFSKHVYVCDVPRGTFVHVIRHHDKLTDFNAALVGNSGCKKLFLETSCRWVSPEGATFTRVTTPLSKECRYDPAPGSIAAWRYGCSLDVPARDLIDGANWWNLPLRDCDARTGTCRHVNPASTGAKNHTRRHPQHS